MKKWLEQQGATFAPGKGSHLKVFLNGRQSVLPNAWYRRVGQGASCGHQTPARFEV